MLDRVFNEFSETVTRAEISMTPLIDMVFLLLIFFAVTTNFTKETGITVDKAKSTTSRIINRNIAMIAIDKDGAYWYDRSRRPTNEIAQIILVEQEKNPELNVVLIPDRQGQIEPLIAIMDALRTLGITRFSIGTQAVKVINE